MAEATAPAIVVVSRQRPSFVAIDAELLARRWPVSEAPRGNPLTTLPATVRAVLSARLVYGWFAGWHTALPVTLAWLLGRPSVVVVGGIDLANLPDIGYGFQRRGPRRWISRWVMARATRLITNSHFSARELAAALPRKSATVVHHGVPDPFGALPETTRDRRAVTVGVVDRRNLERKGLLAFVQAAAYLPDVAFTVVGRWTDDAVDVLRAEAPANVTLAGWLADEALLRELSTAAVYVQASRHEGFGLSVAEAMLAGAIPVVTGAGALPEVVGEAGIVVSSPDPRELATGISAGLEAPLQARARARERVLSCFALAMREQGIARVVEAALAARKTKP